jgi:hypothetical protein
MKPRIKLAFCDFWPGFDPSNNYFTRLLASEYEIELAEKPDFLLYSCFGVDHLKYKCIRIFYSGENVRPDFWVCDYAFTFDFRDRVEHYRLPLYAMYGDVNELIKGEPNCEALMAEKTHFCNFVYSDPRGKQRVKFFKLLSKYKRVDSGGRLFNNIGGPVNDKLSFIRKYKFTIAFENASYPGYTTEKLPQAMWAKSLPIYCGNPLVHLDFNPRSFISYYDHGSLEALAERVIEVDRDDGLYAAYVKQPWFTGNRVNEFIDPANVLAQFRRIFSTPKTPVALRADRSGPLSRPAYTDRRMRHMEWWAFLERTMKDASLSRWQRTGRILLSIGGDPAVRLSRLTLGAVRRSLFAGAH